MNPFSTRALQLLFSWSLASGLILGTTLWYANQLYGQVKLDELWKVGRAIFIGAAAIALPQQVILLREGMHAWAWTPISLMGCALLAVLGLGQEEVIVGIVGRNDIIGDCEYPSILPPLLYGTLFGSVQLLGCRELRQRSLIWILATAAGFVALVYILTIQRQYPSNNHLAPYLVGLAAGVAYGMITGAATVCLRFMPHSRDFDTGI